MDNTYAGHVRVDFIQIINFLCIDLMILQFVNYGSSARM